MVFGAISSKAGATVLHIFPDGESTTAEHYLAVLRDIVEPFIVGAAGRGHNLVYQQDNCPIHMTGEVRDRLRRFRMLDSWPPHSPDISPVEMVTQP